MFRRVSHRTFLRPGILASLAGLSFVLAIALGPPGPVIGQTTGPRFVLDSPLNPLAAKTIRVLCYATATSTVPRHDVLLQTDAEGRPLVGLPEDCGYVAALYAHHTQPSGKPGHGPAYDVYATSWPPGSRELVLPFRDVYLRTDWSLVLFHVVASLEWQPAAQSTFVSELRRGLKLASAYLYDLTEGQMAFGAVNIRTAGRGWNGADLRFRAANDYRPSAYVGGIVRSRKSFTTPSGARVIFAPGEISLGRYWDGRDAFNPATGRWSLPDAYRTLVHEWGHYALFLFDEYERAVDTNGDGKPDGKVESFCTRGDLPGLPDDTLAASIMSYQYNASEFWLNGAPEGCIGTEQWRVYQESDWATLARWGRIQGLPAILQSSLLQTPLAVTPGPELGLAGDLFGRRPRRLAIPSPAPLDSVDAEDTTAQTVFVDRAVSVVLDPPPPSAMLRTLYPQVYLVQDAITSGAPSPARVLYQGSTFGGRVPPADLGDMTLLGVSDQSHARVFVDQYAPGGGGRYVYPAPGANPDPPVEEKLRAVPDTWRASLDVEYDMVGSTLMTMTVRLSGAFAPATEPIVQICTPAAATGCPDNPAWRTTMTATGPTTWNAVLKATTAAGLPRYGLLRVEGPGVGELIRWFQPAGGAGSAHIDAEAPLRDGPVMVDVVQAVSGQRNRVIVMPAANYQAAAAPLPAGVDGILGLPMDLDILLPDTGTATLAESGASPSTADQGAADVAPLPSPVLVTFSHSDELLRRLGIRGDQLRLLHFSPGGWIEVAVSGRSLATDQLSQTAGKVNWLATGPVTNSGIYAIGYSLAP